MTNDQIKQLIREVIAEGIDLDIPDAEISRVVKQDTKAIEERLNALESNAKPSPKPERVNISVMTASKKEVKAALTKADRLEIIRKVAATQKGAKTA